ncbi:HAD family hydrolase [Catenulispora sp. GP43]|uniref:HAD family hydrolase n=1 Tax=Catenulispora sp. GP43 TaxID=3156263 RepID=UPI003515BBBF
MHRVRAAVFDFFGTLTPSRPKSLRDAEKHATADLLGIPRTDWIRAVDVAYSDRVLGVDDDLAAFFERVAENAGYSPSKESLRQAVAERLTSYVSVCAVRDDVVDGLSQLRKAGLRIGLVTDCGIELPSIWDALPIATLVDAAVFSCREHTRKPDPALFRAAARRLEVAEEECLYIGDGGGDEIAGSARVGMKAILFRPNDWADHDASERAVGWAGPEVTSVTELAVRLLGFGVPDR